MEIVFIIGLLLFLSSETTLVHLHLFLLTPNVLEYAYFEQSTKTIRNSYG